MNIISRFTAGLAPTNLILNMTSSDQQPPILLHKYHAAPSAFTPENLLREARRQKNLAEATVPPVCILDPDGDIVRYLRNAGRAERLRNWACYHTDLYVFEQDGVRSFMGYRPGEKIRRQSLRRSLNTVQPGFSDQRLRLLD